MPSAFDNRLDVALNSHIAAEFGVTATYTDEDGVASSVTIVPGGGGGSDVDFGDARSESRLTTSIGVKVSDLASIDLKGKFTIDGVEWHVDDSDPPRIDPDDSTWLVCGLIRATGRRSIPHESE